MQDLMGSLMALVKQRADERARRAQLENEAARFELEGNKRRMSRLEEDANAASQTMMSGGVRVAVPWAKPNLGKWSLNNPINLLDRYTTGGK